VYKGVKKILWFERAITKRSPSSNILEELRNIGEKSLSPDI
jgi:hypothetical protein